MTTTIRSFGKKKKGNSGGKKKQKNVVEETQDDVDLEGEEYTTDKLKRRFEKTFESFE